MMDNTSSTSGGWARFSSRSAEAERAGLAVKTEELEQRLAVPETIVTGVTDAVFERRSLRR